MKHLITLTIILLLTSSAFAQDPANINTSPDGILIINHNGNETASNVMITAADSADVVFEYTYHVNYFNETTQASDDSTFVVTDDYATWNANLSAAASGAALWATNDALTLTGTGDYAWVSVRSGFSAWHEFDQAEVMTWSTPWESQIVVYDPEGGGDAPNPPTTGAWITADRTSGLSTR